METDNSPAPGSVDREPLHHRQIDCRGFRRSDGLFEVEARLIDRKPHDFAPPSGTRVVPAHQPIHDLGVCLVFDDDMVIRAVGTFSDAYPYDDCPQGGRSLQALVGLRIGPGWGGEIRKRLPSSDTCTHLRELLIPLASAAYQSMHSRRLHLVDAVDANGRPLKIGSCYAYGASRDLVKRAWPAFYKAVSSDD